ncbi:MAG: hypothetical protein AB7I04_22400 [Pseudomonadales bacterium]
MPQQPETADASSWHRYFAMHCNNRAWALAVQERDPEEEAEMLNAAHASAYHWNLVGDEIHRMRAVMLLAEVHALAGLGDTALDHADRMRDFFLELEETPDWEIAFVHTVHARAAAVAGDPELHQSSYEAAERAIEDIADAEDRRIVLETFDQVPRP